MMMNQRGVVPRGHLRLMIVYGTRPEAVKLAPIVSLAAQQEAFQSYIVSTGQHQEMLTAINAFFGIQPDVDLGIMQKGASIPDLVSNTISLVSSQLAAIGPDALVVQGDTAAAFGAGLAAFYARVPLIHVEAGLRTRRMLSPFPEESNRRLLAPISALNLAPTIPARDNLLREGIAAESICVTGNTVIDALNLGLSKAERRDPTVDHFMGRHPGARVILLTAHRRESWGEPLSRVLVGVARALRENDSYVLVLPMHRNPVVRETIASVLGDADRVLLCEPLGYPEFISIMAQSTLILTDSGGVQEEAPSLGIPVLVLRDTTERWEAVEAGTVELVGTDSEVVYRRTSALLRSPAARAEMSSRSNPFGDGRAAERCVAAIRELFGIGKRMPDFNPAQVVSLP